MESGWRLTASCLYESVPSVCRLLRVCLGRSSSLVAGKQIATPGGIGAECVGY
jgi:hypothetical protein